MSLKEIHTPLNLKFKGNREYLHGTDIFNALIELTEAEKNLRMRFYDQINNAVYAKKIAAEDLKYLKKQDFSAMLEFQSNGNLECWCVVEDASLPRPNRYSFDEKIITDNATIDKQEIYENGTGEFSFIERAVALNKHLLNNVFSDRASDWWFCRIDLPLIPLAGAILKIFFVSQLGELVKSEIFADGSPAGFIYFMEKSK